MVAGQGLFRLLLPADVRQLLFGAETGIGQTLLHQALTKSLVDLGPVALLVGAVIARFLRFVQHAFVEFDAKGAQALHDLGDAVFHFPLLVRIFNAQDDPAAGLVGRPLVDQGGEQAADVQKAGGAGGEPGHHGPLGQLPPGVDGGHVFFWCLGDMGEQQFRQFVVIHRTFTPTRLYGRPARGLGTI